MVVSLVRYVDQQVTSQRYFLVGIMVVSLVGYVDQLPLKLALCSV